METFQQYLLRQPHGLFKGIPRGGEFASQVAVRRGKIKKYQHDYAKSVWIYGVRNPAFGQLTAGATDPKVLAGACDRYHAAASSRSKSVDKDVLGCLIIEIYTVTAHFMRCISRARINNTCTDLDCLMFQLYRSLNIQAENTFQRLFKVKTIDLFIQRHNISLSSHGYHMDDELFKEQRHIKYFKDAQSLGVRLEIKEGKMLKRDMNNPGRLKLVDTTSPEFRDTTINPCYVQYHHDVYPPTRDGVIGFAMLPNRHIYATMHSTDERLGRVYHSAYSAGTEILCAGTLRIKQGVLTHIDNMSGHYKPSIQQLVLCIQALRAFGIDISDVEVYALTERGANDVRWDKAPKFLADASKGVFARNTAGRFRHTAERIKKAVLSYEKQKKMFSSFKYQSKGSRDALERLKHFIRINDDEGLVRTVQALLGKERDVLDERGHFSHSAIVTAPPAVDSKGAALGPLTPLGDKRASFFKSNRGPGGLKKALLKAMQQYKDL